MPAAAGSPPQAARLDGRKTSVLLGAERRHFPEARALCQSIARSCAPACSITLPGLPQDGLLFSGAHAPGVQG
jgi:hypothetical protein